MNLKIKSKNTELDFNKDEHPRDGISIETLKKLKPVFKKMVQSQQEILQV